MPLSGKVGPNIPGEPVELNTEGVGVEYSAHNWSPDGRWIAFNEDVDVEKIGDEREKGKSGHLCRILRRRYAEESP